MRKFLSVQTAAILLAAIFIASYLVIAYARLTYPYDIDFIEEGILLQARQVSLHLPEFVPPNAVYVPQPYMPLYTWLGGMAFHLIDPAFWPLRLLSLTATMLTAVLIFYVGRRESGDRALAFICAALFLAGYRITGGWYELARVDALYNLLMMAGFTYAVYGRKSKSAALLAGLLLGLSFLTKQNAIFAAAVTGGYLLLESPMEALLFGLAFSLIAGLPVLYLLLTTNGWFTYYVVNVAYDNPIYRSRIFDVFHLQLFGDMVVPWLAFLLAAAVLIIKEKLRFFLKQPWLLFIGAAVFISISGRATVGGALNNLIPAWSFLCLAPALLAGAFSGERDDQAPNTMIENPSPSAPPRLGASNFSGETQAETAVPPQPSTRRRWLYNLLLLALSFQFALTLGSPKMLLAGELRPGIYRPTAAMKTAGDALVERLAAVDGPVWVMMHPYYALRAGQAEPGVHIQTLWHSRVRGEKPLPDDLVGRLQSHYYAAIISDDTAYFEQDPPLQALLNACYRRDTTLNLADAPLTLTGVVVRPQIIYLPRPGSCT